MKRRHGYGSVCTVHGGGEDSLAVSSVILVWTVVWASWARTTRELEYSKELLAIPAHL